MGKSGFAPRNGQIFGAGGRLAPVAVLPVPRGSRGPGSGIIALTYRWVGRPSNCKERGLLKDWTNAGRDSTDRGNGWRERSKTKLPFLYPFTRKERARM